jgi:hypothetical protein
LDNTSLPLLLSVKQMLTLSQKLMLMLKHTSFLVLLQSL